MFEVNGIPLLADAKTVLTEIRQQLLLNDVELLTEIKPTRKNVQFTCPAHNVKSGVQCGMSDTDVKRDGRTIPAGTVHCFTCGYTANIMEFVSFCFGKGNDGGAFGYKWLIKNFVSIEVENRKPMDLKLDRNAKKEVIVQKVISEDELAKYRNFHDYMFERKLTESVIIYFDVGYDTVSKCLTFPVNDTSGRPIFIQRRSVVSKFFNNADDSRKSETIYALDKIIKNINRISEVIVCESIIDALTCWVHKRPAVALMGTGTTQQYKMLRDLPIRKYILALDDDEAGYTGWQKLKKQLRRSQLLYKYNFPEGIKDINQLDWEAFEQLEEVLM